MKIGDIVTWRDRHQSVLGMSTGHGVIVHSEKAAPTYGGHHDIFKVMMLTVDFEKDSHLVGKTLWFINYDLTVIS